MTRSTGIHRVLACAVVLFWIAAAALRADEPILKEKHTVVTADGWTIALHRVRPAAPVVGREPVVLFHGYLENRRYYDLKPGVSLAEHLAHDGFDAWIVEFRGAGESEKPSLLDFDGWTYSVDDYIHGDAPAAIDYVLATTGDDQVLGIGHSMGGLTIYGYLAAVAPAKMKAAVTLAGAGKMGLAESQRLSTLLFLLPALAAESKFPFDAPFPTGPVFKAVTSPFLWPFFKYLLHGPLGAPVWQNKNMSKDRIREFLKVGVGSIGMNISKQGLDWIRHEDVYTFGPSPHEVQGPTSLYYDAHGFYSYTDHLADITTPLLVLAGADDQVVPPKIVKSVYDSLSSPDKTYRVLGKAGGETVDYGHEDLVVGLYSPAEVYPVISAWLKERRSK